MDMHFEKNKQNTNCSQCLFLVNIFVMWLKKYGHIIGANMNAQ